MRISGWGNFGAEEARVQTPRSAAELRTAIQQGQAIARGNGRAYGDSAINKGNTISMLGLNRMIDFDPETGVLEAEAGVLLSDVIDSFLPRGWFPLVVPGTRLITLGGAIASDVHGKNHHVDGSFRTCVDWIDLMGPEGNVARISPANDPDLFHHTIGGMGLTGIILRCGIRLRPVRSGWIRQITHAAKDLSASIQLFEDNLDKPYSVAWIDCAATGDSLGRSLVMLGNHANPGELPARFHTDPLNVPKRSKKTFPFYLPNFALNPLTVRAFNFLYYWKGALAPKDRVVDWDSYFFPLDAVRHWNKLYGKRGFLQFQCVLPLDQAEAGLTKILLATSDSRQASFLSVLKRFGPGTGPLSFPMEGYTLAMDFPNTNDTGDLLPLLDEITLDHDGRFYLTKDARLPADTALKSDPRMAEFASWRRARGLEGQFASSQSERLNL